MLVSDFQPKKIYDYPKYWASCYGYAPFLPTTKKEMQVLGWDSCDVVLITGDAYVDLPSFGMSIIGRLLEAQGFRVGIISQPDWHNKDDFMKLGKPNLYYGITAGNMDSMINRYTADRKLRHDDAYTPGNISGKRPDRAVLVYSQRCREAYKDVPIVLGGIESSLRRAAHYDYWSDKVRRSILIDAKADILLYGNAERALIEVTHRIAEGENPKDLHFIRGTARIYSALPNGFTCIDSTRVDKPGKIDAIPNPYQEYKPNNSDCAQENTKKEEKTKKIEIQSYLPDVKAADCIPETYISIPSFERVSKDKVLYAHASRAMHLETNPYAARSIVQQHGDRFLWINPPPIPLTTEEMDYVYGLPFARRPHPSYGKEKIPAYEMIKTSINIMRGCFGGCAFCSIAEHEGRIIQSRSQGSIIEEIEDIRDKSPHFTGTISDLGGPSANMYRLGCTDPKAQAVCRKPSCIFPKICKKLNTNHTPLIQLYRAVREVKGVKKVMIASGVRIDLAIESPEYIRELVNYHVGGYLKVAPEHTEKNTLDMMMKPGIDTYTRFKELFDKFNREAGKKQYLIPYFIAAHPGTTDEDMVNLALWLKANNQECDQVQNFYPTPMSTSTSMYYTGKNTLKKISYKDKTEVVVPKGDRQRRLHKALLRYHDPKNWPLIREALIKMGKKYLIGNRPQCLIPWDDAEQQKKTPSARRKTGRHGSKRFEQKNNTGMTNTRNNKKHNHR